MAECIGGVARKNSKYVDSLLLLDDKHANVKQNLTLWNDQLVCVNKPKGKLRDIAKWTDAFFLFATKYLEAHHERWADMLKYMRDVSFGARRYSEYYRIYDGQYRILKEANILSSWSIMCSGYYKMVLQSSFASGASTGSMFAHYCKCYDFNYDSNCFHNACRYRH